MKRFVFLAAFVLLLSTCLSFAGANPIEQRERAGSPDRSLNIAINNFGVSFGNSTRFNGLRFNLVDKRVEEINGINVTLWKPEENSYAVIRGISAGLYAPRAYELKGISLGGFGVVAGSSLSGIAVGGLAVVSEGELSGIAVGGLAAVAEGRASGILIGGLASVAEGPMSGISAGGLAVVSGSDISGISVSGGAVLAHETISGISIGVIGTFLKRESSDEDEGNEDENIDLGFSYSGTRARNAEWLIIHGIDIGIEEKLGGIGAAGISVRADEISGIALAGALVKARSLTGFSAGAVNYFDEYQAGLSIGLVNFARELNGVQLGIINIAKNNSSPFRVLPIVNAHFE